MENAEEFDVMLVALLDELDELREQVKWLDCLEASGVDNWEGIDTAHEIAESTETM